jgi:hypothetical protein
VPPTYVADFVDYIGSSLRVNVHQVADQGRIAFLYCHFQVLLPAVEPLDLQSLLLEGNDEDVDIEVPAEGVFVRIEKIVGEGVADVVEVCLGVDLPSQKMVYAVESALEGKEGLFLEEDLSMHRVHRYIRTSIIHLSI